MIIHQVKNGEDFSAFPGQKMKSPFTEKSDVFMRRVFEEFEANMHGTKVMVRGQHWLCPETLKTVQDSEQIECSLDAAALAKNSDQPVLFYHTKAWKL